MDLLQGANMISPVEPLFVTFLIGFTTLALLFWYSSRKQQYWKKLGVPYIPPIPFLGSVLENFTKYMHDVELDRYNKYGRIYGYYEANRPVLSVAEPDILRDILVRDFLSFTGRRRIEMGNNITNSMFSIMHGEDWKRVRTIVTPTFTTGKIKRMLSIFKDCSRTLMKNFKAAAEKGEPIEAKAFYGAFAMDIIASSAFSTKIDSHNDPNNMFVRTARSVFTGGLNWRLLLLILFPGIMRFFRIGVFSPKDINFFADVTLQIIEERKRTGQTRNDFLQLLIDTTKEVAEERKLDLADKEDDIAENYGKNDNDQVFKDVYKKSLSSDELVGQCVQFFLAGYDSTASTLSFATYFLALNPEIQEKLRKEVDNSLRESNEELTYEAVQGMKYLDNIISETIRIFPPGFKLERVADEDYKLADTGIFIPKGMLVTIPVYAIHRDPKHFPDPEKFNPDRFTPEERAKRHPFAFMPFGAGPRNCVAMRFALLQVKVCLAHVLSNFRIKTCTKTKVPLEFYIGNGTLQPKDICVLLEMRKDTVKAL